MFHRIVFLLLIVGSLSCNFIRCAVCFQSISQDFWYFARSRSREIQVNPRNPAKFPKPRKIPQNSVEILSNIHVCTAILKLSSATGGYLIAVNSQISMCNQMVTGEIRE